MEMDTAVPVNVNAYLIMNMNKIAHIMDVSTFNSLVLILLICNLFEIYKNSVSNEIGLCEVTGDLQIADFSVNILSFIIIKLLCIYCFKIND